MTGDNICLIKYTGLIHPLQTPTPSPADPIFRYAWILFILVTIANGVIWWTRSKPLVREQPELRAGYRKLVLGWMIWGNVPWIVMGVMCILGCVPDIFHFTNPKNGNVYVLAWWGTVILLIMAGTYWIFTGGADEIAKHPGLLNKSFGGKYPGSNFIKICWSLATIGWATGTALILLKRG